MGNRRFCGDDSFSKAWKCDWRAITATVHTFSASEDRVAISAVVIYRLASRDVLCEGKSTSPSARQFLDPVQSTGFALNGSGLQYLHDLLSLCELRWTLQL